MTSQIDLKDPTNVAKSTLVIVPRDRFTLAVRSLNSIIEHRPGHERVIYVDAGSPPNISTELKSLCDKHGFSYIRDDRYLSPTQSRNLGAAHVETKYIVFIENDVIVSPNWFQALENCADETGAAVVAPLTCQKEPLHTEVHQAGAKVFERIDLFLDGKAQDTHLVDIHTFQGESVDKVSSERISSECFEFHCVLVRRDVFEEIGPFDEELLATKEHIDFSLSVLKSGGSILIEPKSVVTFLFPDRSNPLQRDDYSFFMLRWSPEWQLSSLNHFKAKWGLEHDPYFSEREPFLDWRYREGIVKPLVRKLPLIGHSYKVSALGQGVMMPFLRRIARRSVRRHQQQFAKTA